MLSSSLAVYKYSYNRLRLIYGKIVSIDDKVEFMYLYLNNYKLSFKLLFTANKSRWLSKKYFCYDFIIVIIYFIRH